MKVKVFLFVFFVIGNLNIFSQTASRCQMKIEDSPAVRGFSLRSKTTDIQKAFPKLKIDAPDKFGVSNVVVPFDRLVSYGQDEESITVNTEDFPQYKGLESIDFEILDGQVVILTIEYDSSVSWKNIAEFIKHTSNTLKLPNEWNYTGYEEFQTASMDCLDFRIESEIAVGNPILRFVKSGAVEIYKKRKAEDEEKAKKNFKP